MTSSIWPAEAIADLIEVFRTGCAQRITFLAGRFSQRVHNLTEQLIGLRIYVEAALILKKKSTF